MKLGDLRRQLRGIVRPSERERVNRLLAEHEARKREPGGRPLDFKRGDVIGFDPGFGDETVVAEGRKHMDGTIVIDSVRKAPKGVAEIAFTGVHRSIHEPDDMSKRRICKAVNAVPGAVLTDHRYCATGVRQLGKSLGDRFLEQMRRSGATHKEWAKLGTTFVMNLRPDGDERKPAWKEPYHFVVCPSESDPPTLVKWFAHRGPTAGGPDEPMRTMFAAVAAEEQPDIDEVPQPTRLHRVSAFALYPAEVRVCWTCLGSRKTIVLARIDPAEPESQLCPRCRGLGVLWDHRPHHSPGAEPTDAEAKLFERAPPPSRLDR